MKIEETNLYKWADEKSVRVEFCEGEGMWCLSYEDVESIHTNMGKALKNLYLRCNKEEGTDVITSRKSMRNSAGQIERCLYDFCCITVNEEGEEIESWDDERIVYVINANGLNLDKGFDCIKNGIWKFRMLYSRLVEKSNHQTISVGGWSFTRESGGMNKFKNSQHSYF